MAINAGVPIIPLCCSNYKRSMNLNRWHSGTIIIQTLPPIATNGLSLDDMSALMERCRVQMVSGLAALDARLV